MNKKVQGKNDIRPCINRFFHITQTVMNQSGINLEMKDLPSIQFHLIFSRLGDYHVAPFAIFHEECIAPSSPEALWPL